MNAVYILFTFYDSYCYRTIWVICQVAKIKRHLGTSNRADPEAKCKYVAYEQLWLSGGVIVFFLLILTPYLPHS